jgi:uracil-DNA glycosylase family 4
MRRNSCSAQRRRRPGVPMTTSTEARPLDGQLSPPTLRPTEPDRDCPLCPRLATFRSQARAKEPTWFNSPVSSFGDADARLLIVGLAPGLQGANRTGRPFTGDYAGDLLYATLLEYGFARGRYEARPDDGLMLVDCLISNAVRCVPPQNKPLPLEINTCRAFLAATINHLPRLRAIVALGRIAHESVAKALKLRGAAVPFAHGAVHQAGRFRLYDSYHCSRYNTNTGVLTAQMFRKVFARVKADLD